MHAYGIAPQTSRPKCYTTLVRPALEYSACVWDPSTQNLSHKLEAVQRRAARYVTGDFSRESSVTAMLNQLQWPTLQLRRQHAKLTMFYKIVHQLIDIPAQPYLLPASTTTRGHHERFLVPTSRLILHQGSYFPSTIRLWNALPAQLVVCSTLEAFRSQLAATTA